MILTPEQQDIFDRVKKAQKGMFETNVVLHIDAKAGTGKTTLVKYIVDSFPGITFLYTAFNKKIVTDGVTKFGPDNCKTFHALAYKYISRPNVGGFYPYAVKEHGLSYTDKKYVVDMLDKYCLSRYLDLDDFIRDMAIPEYSGDLILKYLEKMADRSVLKE